MNILKTCLAATALTAFAASAQANDKGIYVNAGVDTLEFDVFNLVGRAGYQFNENFSAEGELSFGISSEKTDVEGIEVSTKIKNSFGGFLRGSLPVTDATDLFARIGYQTTKFKSEVEGFDDEVSISGDGVAFGLGVEQALGEASGVRFDWTIRDFGDPVDDSGYVVSLAYVHKF